MDRDTAIEQVLERAQTFRGHRVTAAPLSGGHINDAYVVQVDGDQRYVVRIPGTSDASRVVSLDDERHNSVAAAETGASPRVVEVLDDLGVMVVDFVVGEALTDDTVGDRARIPRIAAALKRLHAGRPFRADFDMATVARAWLRTCVEGGIPIPGGLDARMDRVDLAARAGPRSSRSRRAPGSTWGPLMPATRSAGRTTTRDRGIPMARRPADGRTNRQIADALFISIHTAGVHVSNILGKLGVANRGEAAAVAHRLGLVPPGGGVRGSAPD